MLAIVTNFGRPRVFPSCQGNLWLNRLAPVEVRDPELIKQLQKYNERRDIQLEIKIVEDPVYPGAKISEETAKIVEDRKEAEGFATVPKNVKEEVKIKINSEKFDEFKMDYSQFKIQQLRSMAVAKGIEGTFKMTKKLLIEKLEEKDGIS